MTSDQTVLYWNKVTIGLILVSLYSWFDSGKDKKGAQGSFIVIHRYFRGEFPIWKYKLQWE